MKYLFFDTETTGKLSDNCHIVQLAAILTEETIPISQINILIKPINWVVLDEVVKIHGITTEKCERYGIPIGVVLQLFHSLDKQADVIVAHNYDFDSAMLTLERNRIDFPSGSNGEIFCTMQESTDIVCLPGRFGKFKWPKLQEAYKFFFDEEFEGAHDALNDVRACMRIFFEIRKRLDAKVAA